MAPRLPLCPVRLHCPIPASPRQQGTPGASWVLRYRWHWLSTGTVTHRRGPTKHIPRPELMAPGGEGRQKGITRVGICTGLGDWK